MSVALGGAYGLTAGLLGCLLRRAPRGVAVGEVGQPLCYLVPVAKRPVCVTRVRAA